MKPKPTDPAAVLLGARGYAMQAADKGAPPTLYIYDTIASPAFASFMGGVSAKQVTDDLATMEGAEEIAVRINSAGGDVFEGIAIFNALSRFPGKVTVHIDGMAASIASLIALAGDRRLISEAGMVMVHRPWTMVGGDAALMRQVADTLDKGWTGMLAVYTARTGKRSASIEKAINDGGGEWWLTADEAVSAKFADATEKAGKKAAVYGLAGYRHVPESLAASAEPDAAAPPAPPEVLEVAAPRATVEPEPEAALPVAKPAAPAAPSPEVAAALCELEFLAGPIAPEAGA